MQIRTRVPRQYALWHVEHSPHAAGRSRHRRDGEDRRIEAARVARPTGIGEHGIPGFAKHVTWKEAATPVTQKRFTRSADGSASGIEVFFDPMGSSRMGSSADVAGLSLAGARPPSGHGLGNVPCSGVVAAGAALETDPLASLRGGHRIGDPSRPLPPCAAWDAYEAIRGACSPASMAACPTSRSRSPARTSA